MGYDLGSLLCVEDIVYAYGCMFWAMCYTLGFDFWAFQKEPLHLVCWLKTRNDQGAARKDYFEVIRVLRGYFEVLFSNVRTKCRWTLLFEVVTCGSSRN